MSSAFLLSEMLNGLTIDFAFITEHKLLPHSMLFLDSIDPAYIHFASCDNSHDNYESLRCGKGGTAILYHSKWRQYISRIETNSDKITALELKCPFNAPLYMFCVYLPASSSIDEYRIAISDLQSLITFYYTRGKVIIAGDMNAHVLSGPFTTASKHGLLTNFMLRNNLISSYNISTFTGPSCTFKPTMSTLDYFFMDDSLQNEAEHSSVITHCSSCSSDHFPLLLVINQAMVPNTMPHVQSDTQQETIAWHKCTDQHILMYQRDIDQARICITNSNNHCTIDNLNDHIVCTLINSGEANLPKSRFNSFAKPYWNADLKDAHTESRRLRRSWIAEGRPRGHHHKSYHEYKLAKSKFRAKQRLASNLYLDNIYDELNKTAETDFRLFWKQLKKLKRRSNETCQSLKINNVSYEGENTVNGFAVHFNSIFNTKKGVHTAHANDIDSTLQQLSHENVNHYSDILECAITYDELISAISSLKRKKAPGPDGVLNEHVLYGGQPLLQLLLILFNMIIDHESVPKRWKESIIIPLYKGTGKCKTEPKSYRPISLIPCFSKLFEKIILNRYRAFVKVAVPTFPNPQQQGFQESLSCTTASFNLHECIYHNYELGSNIYLSCVDMAQAFDTVWHNGLFVKLGKLGIKGKLLRLAQESYNGLTCKVRLGGKSSSEVPILCGVRQGGVLSSFYYLVFIDQLLYDLQNSGKGARVGNIPCGNPTLADDISLIATSPNNLQSMIDIVAQYTCDWDFKINVSKSNILIITRSRSLQVPDFKILGETIPKVKTVTHLGIDIQDNLKLRTRIEQRCQKGKNSFYAMSVLGLHPSALNPLKSVNFYRKVVLPSILYGSELWNGLSESDASILNRTQHGIVKRIQGLPIRTRSDMCEALVGVNRISSEIEIRKLMFLHTILSLPVHAITSQLFLFRYFQFVLNRINDKMTGFIPDIVSILTKYDLCEIVNSHVNNHEPVPQRFNWKIRIKKCVHDRELQQWIARLDSDHDFSLFKQIKTDLHPSILWQQSASKIDRVISLTLSKAWVRVPHVSNYTCACVSTNYDDTLWHVVSTCCNLDSERRHFITEVGTHCGMDIKCTLQEANADGFTTFVINGSCCTDQIRPKFMKLANNFLFLCLKAIEHP